MIKAGCYRLTLLCEKKNPGRVRNLILVDPVNPWSRHGEQFTRIAATAVGTLALRYSFPAMKRMQRVFLARMYGDPKRISPGTMEGYSAALDHPQTIDYAIILEGEITMVLDEEDVVLKAGDVVVQCGTAHAWSNRSNAPCTIAFVLIDGEFEPALKEKFEE